MEVISDDHHQSNTGDAEVEATIVTTVVEIEILEEDTKTDTKMILDLTTI